MLYRLLQFPASIALYFYCRIIRINNKELLKKEGPLLIASNHPNSFLDAIILASLFKRPIYSLARGDAFTNDFITRILLSLKMLPVYRISEGAENLGHNFTTFATCNEIFKKNGIVLIFSEGRCINEWHLRPLKKGTARLALKAWSENIPLEVLPLGINYSIFRSFGKNIHLNFGDSLHPNDFDLSIPEGKNIIVFNSLLTERLKSLVYEIGPEDNNLRLKIFSINVPEIKKVLLIIPSCIGFIIHYPLYAAAASFVKKNPNDHYDSIIIGLMFILYPFYLLSIVSLGYFLSNSMLALGLFFICPFTLWSYLQLKKQ